MEVLPVGIPHPFKCMVLVHVEGDVPRVVVEEILWNAQPLHYVNEPIIPPGECHVVEGHVL
jgi:hypothetical protein